MTITQLHRFYVPILTVAEKLLTLTWLYSLYITYKDTVPLRWEEEVRVLFGNSGLPGAVIPAGEGHGQGCRKTLDMVHAGPSTGEGRRTPVRILCTSVNVPFKKLAVKYAGEQVFKCIYFNFWSMLPHKTTCKLKAKNKSHWIVETTETVLCQSHCHW